MGAISPRHAGLSRRRCLFRRAHPREKPGFSTWQREIPRDPDCSLEGEGFEPTVPRGEIAGGTDGLWTSPLEGGVSCELVSEIEFASCAK